MAKISKLSLNQTMVWVIVACVPALGVLTFWQGMGFLINLGVAALTGFLCDSIKIPPMRRVAVAPFTSTPFKKGVFPSFENTTTTLVTAILFAAGVPAYAPFWVLIVGMFFAIIIAKHLYGGLGHNIFNPAMVAYAVVLIAFPKEMVVWPSWALDSVSAATPLDHANTSILSHDLMPYFILNAAWLLGGLLLMMKKIIRWMIPAGVVLGMLITACFFPNPMIQLGLGSTMICAFFIATDPVTAPGEPKMRFVYGLLIGVLIILLRHYSSYPDGVAFAILLANICTPLMDTLSIRKSA